MGGKRLPKGDNFKDSDWVILHREVGGLGRPHINDGVDKQYGMMVRDFLSDIPHSPVSDTDCDNSNVENLLMRPVGFRAGDPVVGDVNRIVTIEDMLVGAYTIANTTPEGGIALNVTVTHTMDTAFDTPGTIEIVGTDIDDQVLTESIIAAEDATVQGTQAFKTIVSVTGVGWVISAPGNEDSLEIGFGELIGLPDYLLHDTVLFATLTNVREAVHPTVTSSTTVLALNTVDLATALGGTTVVIYYLAGKWI